MKAMFLYKELDQILNQGSVTYQQELLRMMGFLKRTKDGVLTLEDDAQTFYWYIGAAFTVHPDMKIHSGLVFTLGKGAII